MHIAPFGVQATKNDVIVTEINLFKTDHNYYGVSY